MAAPRNYPAPSSARGTVTAHPHDQRFRNLRPGVLARDRMTCWLCGCSDRGNGGRNLGIDHVVPLAECGVQGISPYNFANMRAAHVKPCRTCSDAAGTEIRCNQIRGMKSPEAGRQRLADLTGREMPGGVKPSKGRPAVRPVRTTAPAGERDWGI